MRNQGESFDLCFFPCALCLHLLYFTLFSKHFLFNSYYSHSIPCEKHFKLSGNNLHLVVLHHSLATGETRDDMHLIPGALERSRNEKQLISIKSYCDSSLKLFLFQVKANKTHLVS